jgi:hypothetical protein
VGTKDARTDKNSTPTTERAHTQCLSIEAAHFMHPALNTARKRRQRHKHSSARLDARVFDNVTHDTRRVEGGCRQQELAFRPSAIISIALRSLALKFHSPRRNNSQLQSSTENQFVNSLSWPTWSKSVACRYQFTLTGRVAGSRRERASWKS